MSPAKSQHINQSLYNKTKTLKNITGLNKKPRKLNMTTVTQNCNDKVSKMMRSPIITTKTPKTISGKINFNHPNFLTRDHSVCVSYINK